MDVFARALEYERPRTDEVATLVKRVAVLEKAVARLGGGDDLPEGSEFNSIREIQDAICSMYGFDRVSLIGPSRHASVVRARQIGYYLCRRRTLSAMTVIGRNFGNRDHTTILHGVKKIDHERAEDRVLDVEISALERRLAKDPLNLKGA